MNKAVKLFTVTNSITNHVAIAVIIISGVCYAENPKWTSVPVFELDMAENSVDDQFKGCEDKAYEQIANTILPNELKSNTKFTKAWKTYNNIPDYLVRIIKVYTSNMIYKDFNNAVRSGRNSYNNQFSFKAAHFLLTRAIQRYKLKKCVTVFRRTNVTFKRNVLGREMRFGSFTSSSFRQDLYGFGSISCFKIETCFGAHIASMSVYPGEDEVLIPPFENFKITDISTNKNPMNCEVLYSLQSIGEKSYMDCELFKKMGSKCVVTSEMAT